MDRPYCEIEIVGVEYNDDGELVFELKFRCEGTILF